MNADDVDQWLRSYVEAWRTYEPEQIAALFSDDVDYRYHPYDEPLRGREAVVASWLGEGAHPGAPTRDEPGSYDATYRTVAVDGLTAVATGNTRYRSASRGAPDKTFDNCFVIRFDASGRCCEFTEWYMQRPAP